VEAFHEQAASSAEQASQHRDQGEVDTRTQGNTGETKGWTGKQNGQQGRVDRMTQATQWCAEVICRGIRRAAARQCHKERIRIYMIVEGAVRALTQMPKATGNRIHPCVFEIHERHPGCERWTRVLTHPTKDRACPALQVHLNRIGKEGLTGVSDVQQGR